MTASAGFGREIWDLTFFESANHSRSDKQNFTSIIRSPTS